MNKAVEMRLREDHDLGPRCFPSALPRRRGNCTHWGIEAARVVIWIFFAVRLDR
jgi:hypothetical protein